MRRVLSYILGLAGLLGMELAFAPLATAAIDPRVEAACLETYVEGMTDDLAAARVGTTGIPALLTLLADPSFPRRDNVVAFLAHLGGDEAVAGLLAFLATPPADMLEPDEDRALLLAPQALGHLASRGAVGALAALLEMTRPGGGGGVLAAAAAHSPDPARWLDDLHARALRGLGLSRAPAARDRLSQLANGGAASTPRQRAAAQQSLALYDALAGGLAYGARPIAPPDNGPPRFKRDADTQPRVHDTPLTYANHPDLLSPMTDDHLDDVLALGSLRVGRTDFADEAIFPKDDGSHEKSQTTLTVGLVYAFGGKI